MRLHIAPLAAFLSMTALAACTEEAPLTNAADVTETNAETDSDGDSPEPEQTPAPISGIVLIFGPELSPHLQTTLENHIDSATTTALTLVPHDAPLPPVDPNGLILSFGSTSVSNALLSEFDPSNAASETVIVKSGTHEGTPAIAAHGSAGHTTSEGINIGVAFASWSLLQELGFAFLHPLEPVIPEGLPDTIAPIDIHETPYWPIRGIQVHTMHPLELCYVLNGWGQSGPDDEAGFLSMLPEWETYLQWLIANKQNYVHWPLLWAESWADFADGDERIERLRKLVEMAHQYGIRIGVDVPMVLHQQNAYRLLREFGELEAEQNEIKARINYLMGAGFDYLAAESGTSEFTNPGGERMLAWMDVFASHLDEEWGAEAFIKNHISGDQVAEGYPDPDTGEDINFNHLTYYADSRLGAMPHTVQHYALDDPAPTYGNDNFSHMHRYMQQEAGRRQVVWHPETAYWVSFDIDVPLFLPIYAERRLHDLRLIADDERAGRMGIEEFAGSRIDGQFIFSSGWEWGYWLNDVIAARAAWNPHMDIADESEAYRLMLATVFRHFGEAADSLAESIAALTYDQQALLIEGRINGIEPANIQKRSGQAYLQGFDAWDDVGDISGSVPGVPHFTTQPEKLGLVEMRNPLHGGPGYSAEVEPLLDEMVITFSVAADQIQAIEVNISAPFAQLHQELADSARITALRAEQIHGLYDYVDGYWDQPDEVRQARLGTAQSALDQALLLVAERESHYRVEADRIAGWRPNPTGYDYTYLWSVRSLWYWWRDEGKAIETPASPCYMNHINPFIVAFGEGTYMDAAGIAAGLIDGVPVLDALAECLVAPALEPSPPPLLLRP